MGRRGGKRFLIWTGVLVGIVIVALVALPIWFPWILRPIANHYGVAYRSYERVGYERFALGGVSFTNRNVGVRAERIELFVPTAWLFRLQSKERAFAAAENWELAIRQQPTPTQRKRSVHAHTRQIQSIVAQVQQWIPSASLTNGVIVAQGERVRVPHVAWWGTNVSGLVSVPKITNLFAIRATASLTGPWRISIGTEAITVSVDVVASPTNVTLKGTAVVGTNAIALAAEFGPEGVLPRTASIDASAFALQKEMLKVAWVAGLSGSARARWNDPGFEVDVAGIPRCRSTAADSIRLASSWHDEPGRSVSLRNHGAGIDGDTLATGCGSVSWPAASRGAECGGGLKPAASDEPDRDGARPDNICAGYESFSSHRILARRRRHLGARLEREIAHGYRIDDLAAG